MSAFETDPLGWTEEWDETYQGYFFFHAASGESRWERPVGMPESEDAKELSATVSTIHEEPSNTSDVAGTIITSEVAEEASQWTVGWDENYQAEFYFHTVSGETVWEMPACLAVLQSQAAVVEGETSEVNETASSDPTNWSCEWDSSYGCDFYFNKVTEESSWEKPACLQNIETGVVVEEEEQKKEEVKEDGKDEKTEVSVEEVTQQLTEVVVTEVVTALKPSRKNSILRRPSARPEMATLLTTSVLGQMSPPPLLLRHKHLHPPRPRPPPPPSKLVQSKRRQSLAPRPLALPPKPLFIREEFRTEISKLFGKIECGELENNVILEGDEDEEEDVITTDSDKKLMPSDVANEILANTGRSSRNLDGIETKRVKPQAIGTYLMKKSPALMKSWQKRYVVLKDGLLKYYANKGDYEGDKAPKGEINLLQIVGDDVDTSAYLTGSANTEMHIHMKGDATCDKKSKASRDRLLVLQAIDEESAAAWLDILKEWVRYLNY